MFLENIYFEDEQEVFGLNEPMAAKTDMERVDRSGVMCELAESISVCVGSFCFIGNTP